MKRNSESIDRISTKQIILESKYGSIKLFVGNDGKINFVPLNKMETGSFSIDLKNEKISTKKIEFIKDNSSLSSALNIGSGGGSSIADSKFDPTTGKLLTDFTPAGYDDIRQNAIDAIGKFDPSSGKLKNIHINDDIKDSINLGIGARNFFDNDGKLKDINFNDALKIDIGKGVTAHSKFDINGKLPSTNIHPDVITDIGKGVTAHGKFDGLTGKLLDTHLTDSIKDNITKGVNARNFFDTDGKLPSTNIHPDVITDIGKGVTAHGKFDLNGKLPSTNIHPDVITDIGKGVTAHGKFDGSTGKLIDVHLSDTVSNNISKGVTAHGKFDASTGKLADIHLSDTVTDNISKGVTAHGKFDINGKLPSINIHENVLTDVAKGVTAHGKFDASTGKLSDVHLSDTVSNNIAKGVNAHDDMGSLDFSLDSSNPDIPIIKLSRGSRGSSSTTLTKSTIGLANTENKSAATIISETLIHPTFTAVSGNAKDGAQAHSDLSSATISVTNGLITFNKGGSRGTSTSALTSTHIGLGNVENKSSSTIVGEAFADNRYLLVSGSVVSGVLAHNDLNTADISIDSNGLIKFNRGGNRGTSTGTTVTKSHVGLANVENKSSSTIVGEAFIHPTFTAVSGNAVSGSAAHTDLSNISISVTNGLVTLNRGGSRGSSTSGLTSAHVGLGNVDNKSSSTIIDETLIHPIFTAVSGNSVSGASAHTDLSNISISVTNGLVSLNKGGNRGISTSVLTSTHVGLGNVDNKSSSTIVGETFTDNRYLLVSGSALSGATAHADLSNISISVTNGLVTLNKGGSRGSSTSILTSTHVGLGNVDNKSSATIVGETFTHPTFTAVSGNSVSGASAHTDLSNISISVTNGLVTLSKGGSRGTSTSALTSTHVGLGNVDNKSSSTIVGETFSDNRYLLVSGSAVSGVLAHNDLNTTDISIDATGKIQFNRGGSRGTSTGATVTKSHVGLANVENKSSSTIVGETFADNRYLLVSGSALSGATAHTDLSNISISVTNGLVTLNKGGTRGSSTSTLSSTHVGLGNVDNKSSATIIGETFVHPTFTAVSGNSVSGASAHTDLSNISISVTNGLVTLSKGGSRGTSTSALTSTHVGLGNVDNKSSSTIVGETLIHPTFIAISGNAVSGNTAYGYFSSGLLKDVNTPEGLKNSNLNLSQAADGTISLARGAGLSSLTANPLSTATFLNTQTSASQARGYFNSSGKLNKTNLTADTATTNLTRLNGGVAVNFFTQTSQPQPTIVIDDAIQVKSITTKNDGAATENLLNGTTYVKTLSPIGSNAYLGGATGDDFYFVYSKNGQFRSALTVDNSFAASQTTIIAYQPLNMATAGNLVVGFTGDLTIKQPILNGTSPGNNNTNAGIVVQASSTTTNAWRMFINNNAEFCWSYTGVIKGYIADTSGGGSLNFTGQHRNIPNNNIDYNNKIGLIVVSSGEYASINSNSITINEALPKVELSSKKNQKNVFGVVSDKEDDNSSIREYNFGNFVSVLEKPNNDNRLIINSLGEGGIWVCNINGNLENGDYITTCEIPGYGMKQDDDLLHNYTVAKITCDCDFNLESPIYICEEFEFEGKMYRRAFVGCTYHCG